LNYNCELIWLFLNRSLVIFNKLLVILVSVGVFSLHF
jgi:hypothetical protein